MDSAINHVQCQINCILNDGKYNLVKHSWNAKFIAREKTWTIFNLCEKIKFSGPYLKEWFQSFKSKTVCKWIIVKELLA